MSQAERAGTPTCVRVGQRLCRIEGDEQVLDVGCGQVLQLLIGREEGQGIGGGGRLPPDRAAPLHQLLRARIRGGQPLKLLQQGPAPLEEGRQRHVLHRGGRETWDTQAAAVIASVACSRAYWRVGDVLVSGSAPTCRSSESDMCVMVVSPTAGLWCDCWSIDGMQKEAKPSQ